MKDIDYRFNRYSGYYEWDLKIYGHMVHPRKLDTSDDIKHYDGKAEQAISELQAMIEDLTAYRQHLAARYGQLETMPYTQELTITRHASRYIGVTYTIELTRTYTDKTTATELRERYPGKERRQALKRYADLKAKHPGIPATENLKKAYWEK